jgi:anti-anti-sigma regulatory factor
VVMVEFKIGEGGTGVLILEGDMTIQRAGELKQSLIESLDKATHLIIDVEKITEVDLSCLQLFCSAHRTSLKVNKTISLGENIPAIFWDTVKKAGYCRKTPCCDDKNCLWIEGGNYK